MLNVENLRKQAKLHVRWHRARYFPVAAQIRSHLKRFEGLSDEDVLAAPFKLSDAQELVARKHGFEDWPALINRAEVMAPSTSAGVGAAVVWSAEPQLFVSDIAAACRFYVEKLGFETVFSYGEPAFYAQVSRSEACLNLRKVAGPVFDDGFRRREPDVLAATITLGEAKPLFLEFQAAGVVFHQALRTEPWGARTFIVEDPDGNLIAFAGSP